MRQYAATLRRQVGVDGRPEEGSSAEVVTIPCFFDHRVVVRTIRLVRKP
jgi:hypothetical protein